MTLQKMKRFVYAPDPHGSEVNPAAWRVLLDFCADFKPHMRILGGDVFEFAPFRGGASAEERSLSVKEDVAAGIELIHQYKATHWTYGNHDDRPFRVAEESRGPLADYAGLIIEQINKVTSKLKVRTYPYRADSFCPIGPRLRAIHGNAATMHTAKIIAETYDNALGGHTHSIDYYQIPSISLREGWTCGCLRNIYAGFNKSRRATLRHRHGFGLGFYFDHSPTYYVYQAASDERGRWLIPSTFKEYGHED